MELEPQVLRNEAQGGILRRPDFIPAKFLLVVAFFCLHLFWERYIHVYGPRLRFHGFGDLLSHGTSIRQSLVSI
jgi:hypothetical protein